MESTKRRVTVKEALQVAKETRHLIRKEDYEVFSESDLNEVSRFVIQMKLKEGKFEVLSTLIYQAFVKAHPDKPMNRTKFLEEFNKLFKLNTEEGRTYYLLNKRPVAFKKEILKGQTDDHEKKKD